MSNATIESSAPLVPRHQALVQAAAARIFPTTTTPGATEAGAVNYIQRALAEVYPNLVPLYRNGCRALDRHAKSRFQAGFLSIGPTEQDAVLTDFDAGSVPGFPRAAEFFATIRRHTMEGVLGEPAYGGNRDLVGWRLVGFPGHQYGYDDAYINRRVDLEPIAMDRPYTTKEAWHGAIS